jgi:hypothetical protein
MAYGGKMETKKSKNPFIAAELHEKIHDVAQH